MKLDERIARHLAGTTLDPASVKLFLRTPPHYHQWGINQSLDHLSLNQLTATDLVAFYLQLYLTGRHKTLKAVLREVRAFSQADANGAHHLIRHCLAVTCRRLLTLEWYELMPRFEAAQEMILSMAPDPHDSLRPCVMDLLEESDRCFGAVTKLT